MIKYKFLVYENFTIRTVKIKSQTINILQISLLGQGFQGVSKDKWKSEIKDKKFIGKQLTVLLLKHKAKFQLNESSLEALSTFNSTI